MDPAKEGLSLKHLASLSLPIRSQQLRRIDSLFVQLSLSSGRVGGPSLPRTELETFPGVAFGGEDVSQLEHVRRRDEREG
jgi:hypothetical protein